MSVAEINKDSLVKDLKAIGVKKGDLLHLKISMRSVGKLNGGANELLDAILESVGDDGTIVSDAFVNVYPLPLSDEKKKIIADDHTRSYAGAFANAMINHPRMERSKHPIQKFAAIGRLAKELCERHVPGSGGYDLLDEMAMMDAKNLTIGPDVVGVGTTHVAIDQLGFKRKEMNTGALYRNMDGEVKLAKMNWNGGCGRGFPKFYPLYREKGGMLAEGKIGDAESVLTSMKRTLAIEKEKLKEDPRFFFCDDPACYSCRISWDHSSKNYLAFGWAWLRKNAGSLSFSRFKNLYLVLMKRA
ncbi:MAG TPA: AAC(3) family N-acetyltransferase [Bacteroidales bacterium]|nr:AAC(3) family N-acetyltransferase [Bacteroidales bacterium]HPE55898.1 AAC(3) family N-acetyltransferase [Bacteroidales bacterium]